jgi:hypothetical protein
MPFETTSTNAVTDDDGKIYLFEDDNNNNKISSHNIMQIAFPNNQLYGYTATFVKTTRQIIFIGGYNLIDNAKSLADMEYVCNFYTLSRYIFK